MQNHCRVSAMITDGLPPCQHGGFHPSGAGGNLLLQSPSVGKKSYRINIRHMKCALETRERLIVGAVTDLLSTLLKLLIHLSWSIHDGHDGMMDAISLQHWVPS